MSSSYSSKSFLFHISWSSVLVLVFQSLTTFILTHLSFFDTIFFFKSTILLYAFHLQVSCFSVSYHSVPLTFLSTVFTSHFFIMTLLSFLEPAIFFLSSSLCFSAFFSSTSFMFLSILFLSSCSCLSSLSCRFLSTSSLRFSSSTFFCFSSSTCFLCSISSSRSNCSTSSACLTTCIDTEVQPINVKLIQVEIC